MEPLILTDVDNHIINLQKALTNANSIKSQCLLLENEKKEALEKCAKLDAELQRLKHAGCPNCSILLCKLKGEKKKREILLKTEKEKFLKSIERALESMDDVNTNQTTNAHQLFTQIVGCGLVDSPQKKEKRMPSFFVDTDDNKEDNSTVLVNETIVAGDIESDSEDRAPIVVPETEPLVTHMPNAHRIENPLKKSQNHVKLQGHCSRSRQLENVNPSKENRIASDEETATQHTSKKFKYSPNSNENELQNMRTSCKQSPTSKVENVVDKTLVLSGSDSSPSVLSEIIEEMGCTTNYRMNKIKLREGKETAWKMKPSVLVESNALAANGRKMKQMTLSLARPQKKHDISLSQVFNGGVSTAIGKHSDEDKDVILASPENLKRRTFPKKPRQYESMEDPDMTVFHPAITSTCLPGNNSFDRFPEPNKSPPYKYRRETVRKKADRLKLPGQECDECAQYYEAAGLDKTQEIQRRMNVCSRHRDKYQIRAHTPPGFWDPVMPISPEQS